MKRITFDALPVHDTNWGITTGRDGNVYIGVCGELTDGLSVFIVRYNPVTEQTEYMLEVGAALNEPADSGRAPICKLHYSMLPGSDGLLYCATHYSGPPAGDAIWRPWHTWDDPKRMATGFHIFTYDPATEAVNDFGAMSPNEGCRALALAEKRKLLYGITWPRDRFFIFDLDRKQYRDLGRIGEVNPQCVWLDESENAYTVDDFGRVVKYCADEDKLTCLDARVPQDPDVATEERSVYDSVPALDGKSVYGVTWNLEKIQASERLFRFNFNDGTVDDFGPACGANKLDHAGGMVFGDDGYLYYSCSRREPDRRLAFRMYLFRMDPETGQKEEIGPVDDGIYQSEYIAKATKDFAGNLYFADTNSRPTKMYIYTPEGAGKDFTPKWPLVRMWG